MAKLKLRFEWLLVVLAVLILAGTSAQAKTDSFFVAIGPNNEFLDGGGSGYGDAKWHFYRNNAWWSQWFYSGAYDPSRKQLIDVSLTVEPLEADQPCLVQIAYNWTTSAWSQLGRNRPPLLADVKTAADEAKFIQRRIFFSSQLESGSEPITVKKHLEIPYYNPQWVSINVRGRNFVLLDGSIDHRCAAKDSGAIAAASEQQASSTTGACCLPDGSCLDTDERTCLAEDGTFMGAHTNCRTTDCTQPPPQTEACCWPDGSCDDIDLDECSAERGEPQGPGTTCATVSCPQPETEACCFDDGSCDDLTEQECLDRGGTPQGPRATCATTNCPQPLTEACCWPDGSCDDIDLDECSAERGEPQGPGTTCATVSCPQPPTEACCFDDGSCADLTEQDCLDWGHQPMGYGTTCATITCPQPAATGACCRYVNSVFCVWECHNGYTAEQCSGLECGEERIFLGYGSTCAEFTCSSTPLEACCLADGSCQALTPQQCLDSGGTPQGPATACQTTLCPQPPPETQACCLLGVGCLDLPTPECISRVGTPQGPGTKCQTTECPCACCFDNGNCEVLTPTQCVNKGGNPLLWVPCAPDICPQTPPERQACCFDDGSCDDLTEQQCLNSGGTPQGPGTACQTTVCPQPQPETEACCLPDGSCDDLTEQDCLDRGGMPLGPDAGCLGDRNGDGIDDACEQVPPPEPGDYLKWSQPPVEIDPTSEAGIYHGWDEQSIYGSAPILADDWLCGDKRPITDIHWWGSFLGWTRSDQLPPVAPKVFHIGIWTDVPAAGEPFSHPGTLIWENYCENWAWDFAGYDKDPRTPQQPINDACFRFNQVLRAEEWFYQGPTVTGLVGHYRLDEEAGSIAPDSAGQNDGILYGNPVWQPTAGKIGGALDFDGVDDYVDCGNAPIFDITSQITVAAWVNTTTVPADWTGIVTKGHFAWRLSTVLSERRFHFAVTGGPPWYYVNGNTVVGAGEWHHVCGTYDGSAIRIYVDGVEDGSTAYSGAISTNNFNVWIGANAEVPGREFHGSIDDVRLYNQALKQDEIWTLSGGNGNGGGTRIYWLSIAAIYDPAEAAPQYPWGWKNRPHFFNDDAVRIMNPIAPTLGANWLDGEPITFQDVSWDMAFELTTNELEPGSSPVDLNPDGAVNFSEFVVMAGQWLQSSP